MKSRRWLLLLSFMLILSMVLAACAAPQDGTPVPGAGETPVAPAPDETPLDGETPETLPETGETPEGETPAAEAPGEPVTISFWAAPNPPQEAFWAEMASQYAEENPNVTINVRAMPEAPTSEAGIQSALAGGNAPTASENIFIGFGGELARSGVLVPLEEIAGWDDLIQGRSMSQTIEGWQITVDGEEHHYILPVYSNAMLFGWRTDLLEEVGVTEVPRTYSEVLEAGRALKEQYPDRFIWARPALAQDTWWERWFDFFILYYAASDGQPLITGNEFTADDAAAVEVLSFLRDLAAEDLILTQEVSDPFETGLAVASQIGPWTFTAWAERFPELVIDETFVLTPPPAPDDTAADAAVNTFADAKGIVFYNQSTEEERAAMWEFLQWVFANPENDLLWLERTSLPPARDDLAENEAFQAYFGENPELVPYAEALPNAVPPISHPNYTEIQTALGEQAVVPVVLGQKEPQQAWDDFKTAAEPMLQQ
ncbi:MAG: extracellular solute-binding protein [Anaerolineae bacterium]